jgi:hypothetical protein
VSASIPTRIHWRGSGQAARNFKLRRCRNLTALDAAPGIPMVGGMSYLAILASVACIYLSHGLAARRGRSTQLWMWLAVATGPLALLALWLLPAKAPTVA